MNTTVEKNDTEQTSVDDVEIHSSEAGSDPEVGHTPGKAEGVEDPELDGNQDA